MLSQDCFEQIFFLLILATELIRLPFYISAIRRHRYAQMLLRKTDWKDRWLFLLVIISIWGTPIIKMRTNWFGQFDYHLPDAIKLIGMLIYVVGLALLVHSHIQLKQNWSPTVELNVQQKLITTGAYQWVRHPIYAAIWLMVIAQTFLVNNWIAGFSGIAAFFLLYRYRVNNEEQMLEAYFGQDYREYTANTPRIIPLFPIRKGKMPNQVD